jgi:hypothetical protein
MKQTLFVAVLLVATFAVAPDAKACFDCCVPPPYTRPVCCSSICGAIGCTTTSGTNTFFTAEGGTCSSNDEYCGDSGGGVQHKNDWVRCAPTLSRRWQLVAVRVTRTPPAKIASKG